MPDVGRALVRVLAVLGAVHLATAAALVWLWRHRGPVTRALAEALAEEARRRR